MFRNKWLWLLVLIFAIACNDENQIDEIQSESQGIEKEFTLGGAPIRVIVHLSDEELSLTDFLILTIRIESEEGVRVSEPNLTQSVFAPSLLVESPRETQFWDKGSNKLIQNWDYKLEPIGSGGFAIQPFIINFRLEREQTDEPSDWPVHSIQTDPIPYSVTSVAINPDDQLRDVKGPILPAFRYIYLILALLITLVIGGAVFLYQRLQKQKNHSKQAPVNPVNYYLDALQKLDQLEQSEWLKQKNYEAIFVELSAILRHYIEKFFHLKAEEQTTEEFIREIATSTRFTGEQNHILHQFLSLADLVKFATYDPDQETSNEAIKTIRNFITVTGSSNEV